MNLDEIRKEIDKVDQCIIDSLDKRFKLVDEVYEYKIRNNVPIVQNGREKQVIEQAKERWKELGNEDEEFVEEFITLLIRRSREKQEEKLNGKS
jgi:chorismate mutase